MDLEAQTESPPHSSLGERMPVLLIQKRFFDEILAGEKKYEYRANSAFYKRMFRDPQPKEFLLLCGPHQAVIKVDKIELIPIPPEIAALPIKFTPLVYRIEIKSVRRRRAQKA